MMKQKGKVICKYILFCIGYPFCCGQCKRNEAGKSFFERMEDD